MCMMTMHSALIEFRFRTLPKKKAKNPKNSTMGKYSDDSEDEEENLIRMYSDNGIMV